MTPHRTREVHMRLTTDTMLVALKEGGRVTARTPILKGKIKKILECYGFFGKLLATFIGETWQTSLLLNAITVFDSMTAAGR